jgi:hypothetical protein
MSIGIFQALIRLIWSATSERNLKSPSIGKRKKLPPRFRRQKRNKPQHQKAEASSPSIADYIWRSPLNKNASRSSMLAGLKSRRQEAARLSADTHLRHLGFAQRGKHSAADYAD